MPAHLSSYELIVVSCSMEFGFRIYITISILSVGVGQCLALNPSDGEFLLTCSLKSSCSRPSDWTATQVVNGNKTYCCKVIIDLTNKTDAVSPNFKILDLTNAYLIIVFITGGAMFGVCLTLCVIKLKSMRTMSKPSAGRCKNTPNVLEASRDTLHYYESVGNLTINSRHRVYHNTTEGLTLSPMDTYINTPLASLEHHQMYINTDQEETTAPHDVIRAILRTLEEPELDLLESDTDSMISQMDIKYTDVPFSIPPSHTAVSYRHSQRNSSANDQLCSNSGQLIRDYDNVGYIIPITPRNSQLSISSSAMLDDVVLDISLS